MFKKNYLSPTEQEVFSLIREKDFLDADLIRLIFPDKSRGHVRKILHALGKKGYLLRVQRDFYVRPGQMDIWAIALRLHEGYLGLASALRLHNLIEYEDVTVFIITEKYYKNISFGEHELKYIPLRKTYTGYKTYGAYAASTPEKTIFDCLLKVNLVGYATITKALFSAKQFNWDEFLVYFRMSDNASLHQRTGDILQMLAETTGLRVPSKVMRYLKSRKGSSVRLGDGKTVWDKEWNVQDALGKQRIMGWWR